MTEREAWLALAVIAPLSMVAVVALLRGYSISIWRDNDRDDEGGDSE